MLLWKDYVCFVLHRTILQPIALPCEAPGFYLTAKLIIRSSRLDHDHKPMRESCRHLA